MFAFGWNINQLINKDKNLINKFPCDWRHPVNNKYKRIYITGNNSSPYSVATGSENYYLLAPNFSFIKKVYLQEYIYK